MTQHESGPPSVDVSTPNVARMWDYYLGGRDNFAADREAADHVLQLVPQLKLAALAHRAFLTRVVEHLAAAGIDQFIDLGSGLPTQGNVHEVARKTRPDARVVYADYDEVVCVHGRALLAGSEGVDVVQADVRRPGEIVDNPDVRQLIDFSRPVAVLMVAVMHFITDEEDPRGIVGQIRDAMAPGSYLALTHGTRDGLADDPDGTNRVLDVYSSSTAPLTSRSRDEVHALFDGFELVDPGLTWLVSWGAAEPVENPERSLTYVGVGRKP